MTALDLFLYIILGLVFQLTILAGTAFYRHWQVFKNMQRRLADFDAPQPQAKSDQKTTQKAPSIQTIGWTGLREFRVQRKIYENLSRSVCSFYLVPTDNKELPPFEPGQYLTFKLKLSDPVSGQSRDKTRCYSLSDRPGLEHYRISIKRVPAPFKSLSLPPGLSSNAFHDHIQEGSLLQVGPPQGDFFLDTGETPAVLIAGGIGITPMLSMINESLFRNPNRELWLFYGITNSHEHVMKETLEILVRRHRHFRLNIAYSRPLPGDVQGVDYHHKGHVDITLLRLTLGLKPYHFYICGPQAMMDTMVPALKTWEVPETHIHFELFGPASFSPPAPPANLSTAATPNHLNVTFNTSEKMVPWDDHCPSLLQLAEQNGIQVDSGCRAGSCGICQTEIIEGEVTYSRPPEKDLEPGKCHLCITRPKTNLTLLA
ncbi:MAG: oxidoreductase FAD/NAD(P)-binding domain protein [Magnetococcales bacterium]|nr:oxidoreductase FAD/NAD(P)-binding domain protein [Magnetococcales bacterium]HIJ82829.1 2Fe-2S iron-sulfur cluster binding domain-containing protein [Magnetococcales bacterium]